MYTNQLRVGTVLLLSFLMGAFINQAFATPLQAGNEPSLRFPNAKGESRDKKSVPLPREFQGELNLILVAFSPDQALQFASWQKSTQSLRSSYRGLRLYELLVLDQKDAKKQTSDQGGSGTANLLTVFTDRKRFRNSLKIDSDGTTIALLVNSKNRVVWRSSGEATPEKGAELQKFIADWRQEHEVRLENAEGGSVPLSEFRGKVTTFLLAGRGSVDPGNEVINNALLATSREKDVAYVMVADMRGAPGFVRGQIRDRIKGNSKQKREEVIALFQKAGLVYEPRHAIHLLLDWDGRIAKEFSVTGKFDSAYHVITLNRKGEIVRQFTQQNPKKGDTSPSMEIAKAVKEALAQ